MTQEIRTGCGVFLHCVVLLAEGFVLGFEFNPLSFCLVFFWMHFSNLIFPR